MELMQTQPWPWLGKGLKIGKIFEWVILLELSFPNSMTILPVTVGIIVGVIISITWSQFDGLTGYTRYIHSYKSELTSAITAWSEIVHINQWHCINSQQVWLALTKSPIVGIPVLECYFFCNGVHLVGSWFSFLWRMFSRFIFLHWLVRSPLPATQWLVLRTIAHDSRVTPPGSGSRAYLMAALTRHVTTRSLVWDCGFWDGLGVLPPSPPPPPYGRYCPRLAVISQGKIPWNTPPWLGIEPGPRGGQTVSYPTELSWLTR